MKPLPVYIIRHQAAQDAGHFTPHHTATMNTPHIQPIVTNARQGKTVSTANRPRRAKINRPVVMIGLALVVFWIVAGLLAACAR